jgi:hypothetical protein
LFAVAEAFEGPAIAHGAVEPFHLAVGLWPVGRVFFAVMPSSMQVSCQAKELQAEPLSDSTRSTVTP